ncbi:MAG: TatD family hydrolase [Candidatus Dormibacteria bacterium]
MTAVLVDCHAHLGLLADGDLELERAVVDAARAAGVTRLLNIGLGPDNAAVVDQAKRHPDGVFAAVGWHPHEAAPPTEADLDRLGRLARDPRVLAIGEIGLDYHWRPGYHEVSTDIQKSAFRSMLTLALELDLPVVIHDREAHADTLAIIREYPGTRGAMHAFSGDLEFALACVEVGLHLSIAGPVTYPKADALRAAVAAMPLERLLVETDAPFLPPQPWRGKPNQPAYVVETARRVAEVRGIAPEDLAEATTSNATRLFGFPS